MSLYNGLDLIAIVSHGVYTETYTSASDPGAIANLYASFGLFEDAPNISFNIIPLVMHLLRRVLE